MNSPLIPTDAVTSSNFLIPHFFPIQITVAYFEKPITSRIDPLPLSGRSRGSGAVAVNGRPTSAPTWRRGRFQPARHVQGEMLAFRRFRQAWHFGRRVSGSLERRRNRRGGPRHQFARPVGGGGVPCD